jgi:hypothetical protein
MADTAAASGLTVQQWDDKFFTEYVRESRFAKYMGTNENAIIQVKDKLTTKKGKYDTFALVNRLSGAGVTGNQTLLGNEEDLASKSYKVTVDMIRHGVRVPKLEEQYSAIDLREAARTQLKTWAMEKTRDDIIKALGSVGVTAPILYASATSGQKDTWTVNNSDRVLFGAAVSNYNATHATALATIDNTADKCTITSMGVLKRIAQTASPKIRPIRTDGDEEWYVAFVNTWAMRDLLASMKADNIAALPREGSGWKTNPVFTGAGAIYDGIIYREIPEIGYVTSGVQCGPVYLCGAQAVGLAWAQRSQTIEDTLYDYKAKPGVAVEEIRAIEKLTFGTTADGTTNKDNGVATGWFAAVADA